MSPSGVLVLQVSMVKKESSSFSYLPATRIPAAMQILPSVGIKERAMGWLGRDLRSTGFTSQAKRKTHALALSFNNYPV